MSYIDSSRRIYPRRRRKNVYNRRPGYCVWRIRQRHLRPHLLDHHVAITKKLDRSGQAFLMKLPILYMYGFTGFDGIGFSVNIKP